MYNDYSAARMRARRTAYGPSCGCSDEHRSMPVAAAEPEHGKKGTWGLSGYPLASVYAPLQTFGELYDLETALKRGTVFSELDLPFVCGDSVKGGGCRG